MRKISDKSKHFSSFLTNPYALVGVISTWMRMFLWPTLTKLIFFYQFGTSNCKLSLIFFFDIFKKVKTQIKVLATSYHDGVPYFYFRIFKTVPIHKNKVLDTIYQVMLEIM